MQAPLSSDLKSSHILVVEDLEFNLMIIEEILRTNGYSNISKATSGAQALELVESLLPDLIVLDLIMPGIDGFEVCKKVKNNPKTKDIPIIIQSAAMNSSQRQEAFKAGANDFISKPVDAVELASRVRIQLEQKRLYLSILSANQRMEAELKHARDMLLSLLPSKEDIQQIANHNNISISSYYKPSSELGGDFCDVFDLGDGKIGVYLWDFAGHGVAAAINTFRLHTVIKDLNSVLLDPGKFLTYMNKKLYELLDHSQYATMFYGVLDTKNQILSYACAGCPAPVLASLSTGKTSFINPRGFPIGVQDKIPYETQHMEMKDWNLLMLYSDALIETPNKDSEFITAENIIKYAINDSNNSKDASVIKNSIMEKFNAEYSKNLDDDLTLKIITK